MRFKRAVDCVLLILISYGATAEAAHKHGFNAPQSSTVGAFDRAHQTASENRTTQFSDCLICQFHQQLFNGLLEPPAFISKPQARSAIVSQATANQASQTIASQRGRAPPQLSSL